MTTSAIKFESIPLGVWAELKTSNGDLKATICPFGDKHRICFAGCTGAVAHLQGKVLDLIDFNTCKKTIEAIEVELLQGAAF